MRTHRWFGNTRATAFNVHGYKSKRRIFIITPQFTNKHRTRVEPLFCGEAHFILIDIIGYYTNKREYNKVIGRSNNKYWLSHFNGRFENPS